MNAMTDLTSFRITINIKKQPLYSDCFFNQYFFFLHHYLSLGAKYIFVETEESPSESFVK